MCGRQKSNGGERERERKRERERERKIASEISLAPAKRRYG